MDTRISSYGVITDDRGRLLMCRWRSGNRTSWTLPGGEVEFEERPVDTVRREAREETGLRIAVGEPIGADSRVIAAAHRQDGKTDVDQHQIRMFYRGRVAGGRLRPEVDGPIDRVQWFALDDLPDRRFQLVDVALGAASTPEDPVVPGVDAGTDMDLERRWEHRNEQSRVNAYGVIVEDGRVLLSRWAARQAWTLTGGQLDPGETPAEAAARFTFAETGYRIELGRLRWIDSRVHPPWSERAHPQHAISLYYDARIVGGELTFPDPEVTQTDRPEWFALDDLPEQRVREVTAALKALGLLPV